MPEIPTITIFVRHSRSGEKSCKYADDETYRKCRCPKHLRWSVNGEQFRASAKSRTWEGAEAERRRIEAGFADTGKAPATTDEAKTIRSAVETFITSKQNDKLSPGVISKYKLELGRLERFMSGRRKFLPKQIDLDDLIAFRSEWMELYPSSSTRHNVQARLRAFLRYCHDAGHIDRLPRLSPIKVDTEPVQPLTDEQYDKLLAAIPTKFKKDRRVATRLRAIVQTMRHSGLALIDAATLRRDAIKYDKKKSSYRVVTKRKKTGTAIDVLIPNDVAKEILATPNQNPDYLFWNSGRGKKETVKKNWDQKIRTLFDAAGITPRGSHRLRDTFARFMLQHDVPLADVSRLLGHETIRTTEKYYAAWVPERQARLDDLVQRAHQMSATKTQSASA